MTFTLDLYCKRRYLSILRLDLFSFGLQLKGEFRECLILLIQSALQFVDLLKQNNFVVAVSFNQFGFLLPQGLPFSLQIMYLHVQSLDLLIQIFQGLPLGLDDLQFILKLFLKTFILFFLDLQILTIIGFLLIAFDLQLQICFFLDELEIHLVELCYLSFEAINLLLMDSQQLLLLLLETRPPVAQSLQLLIKRIQQRNLSMPIFLQLGLQLLYLLLVFIPLLFDLLNRLLILEVLRGIDRLLFLQCGQFLHFTKVDDLRGFLDELDLGGCILRGSADYIVYVQCEFSEMLEQVNQLQVLREDFEVVLVDRLYLGGGIEVSLASTQVQVVLHG